MESNNFLKLVLNAKENGVQCMSNSGLIVELRYSCNVVEGRNKHF